MRQSREKWLKRAIPLALAAIIAAGTLFSTLGAVFAKAVNDESSSSGDSNENSDYSVIMRDPTFRTNLNDKDSKVSMLKPGARYHVNFQAYLELKKPIVLEPGEKPDESMTPQLKVSINGDCDFTEDRTASKDDDRWSFKGTPKPKLEDVDTNSGTEKATQKETTKKQKVVGYTYEYDFPLRANTGMGSQRFNFAIDFWLNSKPVLGALPTKIENVNDTGNYEPGTYDSGDDDTSSSKAEVLTTPKMIITNFDIPDEVEYGEEFTATVEFMNNSKVKSMENVSMTVTPSESVAILNGVNKRHYVTLPRRQSTTETFRFKASDKLAAEAVTLTVKWDYQYKVDGAYKDASSEEVLSIKAIPKPEEEKKEETTGTEGSISSFEILSIVPPEEIYPNEPAYVTVKVINKDHQFDASNVQLTITGDGLLNNGNTEYHGALTHSTQAEIETEIQFEQPGTYQLLATVVYEDSVGKDDDNKPIVRINDRQKEFTVVVKESPMMGGMDGMGGMGMEGMDGMGGTIGMSGLDENGMPVGGSPIDTAIGWIKTHVALSAGGGVALVIVIVLAIRFIRKKKAENDEDI